MQILVSGKRGGCHNKYLNVSGWFWKLVVSKGWKGFAECVRKSLNCLEQTVNRNLEFEEAAPEGSKGNEENIIRN